MVDTLGEDVTEKEAGGSWGTGIVVFLFLDLDAG